MRNKWKQLLNRLPIRQQMMLVFTLPIVLIFAVGMGAVYPRVYRTYMTNTAYSFRQTCLQAKTFIASYFRNMLEVSELIATDPDIREVLGSPGFLEEKTGQKAYEEFQLLNNALERINLAFPSYRVGIYLPEQVPYTVNRYHIYPDTELERFEGGEWYTDPARVIDPFFSVDTERVVTQGGDYRALVLLRGIFPEDTGNVAAGAAKVSVNADRIGGILTNASVSGRETVILLDENGKILYATGEVREGEEIREERLESIFASTEEMARISLGGKSFYALGSDVIEPTGWRLILAVPTGVVRRQTWSYFSVLLAILAVVVLSTVFVSYGLARYYSRRLEELSDHMRQIREGSLNAGYREEANGGDEFNQIAQGFNYMMQQIRKLMQEHFRMGKTVKSAELRALQAQINPHFLYNTLDLINWMAMDFGTTEIAEIAQNLARFYRLSLNRGRTILTIGEEIEHVQAYVNIENFHFDNAIVLEVDAPEEVRSLGCPNIILQPFVENAIVHGIAEREEITSCRIGIRIVRENDRVVFSIRDDGPGMEEELMRELEATEIGQLTRGYGVRNINMRLKLYFGEQYGVHYEAGEEKGTTVRAVIPAMGVEEMEASVV